MGLWRVAVATAVLVAIGAVAGFATPGLARADQAAVARGAYVVRAAGCLVCHTDAKNKGAPLAGGRALSTPFGTFYTPNITPDPKFGIGAWSDEDFARALGQGVAPDGHHYYPAFPYTSYTGMAARDVADLKAYIFAQAPVARANRPHDLHFPFNVRALMGIWKMLFFKPGRRARDPARDEAWNRGAYLVAHLGHCGECHTPRNFLGARDEARALAGNPSGPEGKKVPNITPHQRDGIGAWSASDLAYFLKTGFLPDGDVAGGAMTEVIEESTSHLSDSDRAAIATYLLAQIPVPEP